MLTCTHCGQTKTFGCFPRVRGRVNGVRGLRQDVCRACQNITRTADLDAIGAALTRAAKESA